MGNVVDRTAESIATGNVDRIRKHLADSFFANASPAEHPHVWIRLLKAALDTQDFARKGIFRLVRDKAAAAGGIDDADEEGDTALHHAVRENLVDAVDMILEVEVDVFVKNQAKMTPSDIAVNGENVCIVLKLLGFVEARHLQRQLSECLGEFREAYRRGMVSVVRNMLRLGIPPDTTVGQHRCLPIIDAAQSQAMLMFRGLLSSESIRRCAPDGSNLLEVAARAGSLDMMKALKEFDEDFCRRSANAAPAALISSVKSGNARLSDSDAQIIGFLVELGADITAINPRTKISLLGAAMVGSSGVLNQLERLFAAKLTVNKVLSACTNDFGELQETIRQLREPPRCIICVDGAIDCVFIPCGHACVCRQCSASIARCPMCRSDIEQKQSLWIATLPR
jgi:hypothetical protein